MDSSIIKIIALFYLVSGCSNTEMAASNRKPDQGSSKCDPKLDSKCTPIKTSAEEKPLTSDGKKSDGNKIEVDDGALIARNIAGFFFSGDGPGSCALSQSCGLGAPSCPAGFEAVSEGGLQGDCTSSKGYSGSNCHGNRSVCKGGASVVKKVATDLIFQNSPCIAPWEPAGPIDGGRYHVLGLWTGSYQELFVCRKTVPIDGLVAGTPVVTDLKLLGNGARSSTPLQCPTGYKQVGTFPDCVYSSITPRGTPNGCSGYTTACMKAEVAQ